MRLLELSRPVDGVGTEGLLEKLRHGHFVGYWFTFINIINLY